MKNRYFGDIYDYLKYALLRELTIPKGPPTSVCWMRTEDGDGNDGRHTRYLREPQVWRALDPQLFDFLTRQVLRRKSRNIRTIERAGVLPNCRFFSDILTDDRRERQAYFDQFFDFARGSRLVFFDPDNGIEVESVKYGRQNSSRYLYWEEIGVAAAAGHGLLIYQHLPPQPRKPYVRRLAAKVLGASKADTIYTIRTRKVAFFLVPGRGSEKVFHTAVSAIGDTWHDILWISMNRRR